MLFPRKGRHVGAAFALFAGACVLAACARRSSSNALERVENPSSAQDAGPAVDPNSIAAEGIYADVSAGSVSATALEFTPDYPLWSDGAHKRRWVMLPDDTQIDTSDMDHWTFPVGTKFVKEFSLDGVRLETRVIERVSDTGTMKKDLALKVFVWNEEQTEAQLVKDGVVDLFGTPHDVPRQKDCLACHVGEPSGTLGFSAIQLSGSGMLGMLDERGLLSDPPGRAFALPGSEVERAAIGMLHANCGHCHTEGSPADVMRLRVLVSELEQPFAEWQLYRTTLGEAVTNWSPRPDAYGVRVVPGDPDASALVYRMQQRESETSVGEQMPPLASEQVDVAAVAAVRAWIAAMPRARAPAAEADAAPPLVTIDAGPSEMMPALAEAGEPAPMDAGEPTPIDADESTSIDAGDGSDVATVDASAVDAGAFGEEMDGSVEPPEAAIPDQTNPDAGAAEVEPDV